MDRSYRFGYTKLKIVFIKCWIHNYLVDASLFFYKDIEISPHYYILVHVANIMISLEASSLICIVEFIDSFVSRFSLKDSVTSFLGVLKQKFKQKLRLYMEWTFLLKLCSFSRKHKTTMCMWSYDLRKSNVYVRKSNV